MGGTLYAQKSIRRAAGANAGVPVGTILPDAGRIPPPGFLGLCIGAPVIVPAAGYPQLLARTWCGESDIRGNTAGLEDTAAFGRIV